MASDTRAEKPRPEDDGVRILRTPEVRSGIWLLAVALALAGVSLLLFVRPLLMRGGEQVAQLRAAAPQSVTTPGSAAPAAAKPAAARAPVRLEPIRAVEEKAVPAGA